jgi:hypothetical protein
VPSGFKRGSGPSAPFGTPPFCVAAACCACERGLRGNRGSCAGHFGQGRNVGVETGLREHHPARRDVEHRVGYVSEPRLLLLRVQFAEFIGFREVNMRNQVSLELSTNGLTSGRTPCMKRSSSFAAS